MAGCKLLAKVRGTNVRSWIVFFRIVLFRYGITSTGTWIRFQDRYLQKTQQPALMARKQQPALGSANYLEIS